MPSKHMKLNADDAKQSSSESNHLPADFPSFMENATSDFSVLQPSTLAIIATDLKTLCMEFDPYNPEANLKEMKNLLVRYNLLAEIENPFEFTRKTLKLMDLVEQAFKHIKH
jgi:hypothetical protein